MREQAGFLWYGSESAAHEYLNHLQACWSKWQQVNAYVEDDEEEFSGYGDLVALYGDVAVVPISGSLGYKETSFTRYFGMMTYETIANVLAAIVTDGRAKHVVLDIDSPGGLARGTSTASDAIRATSEAGLSVTAHTAGDMLSAAYWLGSAADKVVAAKTAEVGSIGVLMVHQEISKMLKDLGIETTVFRKGEEKALGTPYEPLDDKAKASIDARLERAYSSFIDTVAEFRGLSSDFVRTSIATGRVFSAGEALQLGLIDSIQSFNDLMNSFEPPKPANSYSGATPMSKTPILHAVAPAGLNLSDPVADPEFAALAAAAGMPDNPDENAEEAVTEGKDDEGEEEGEEEEEAQATTPTPSPMAGFTEMLNTLNAQLVASQVELEKTKSERDDLRAGNAGLRQIVVEQTQNFRIRLGQPPGSDLEAMQDSTLVAAHQAVRADFLARFKPGPVSSVPKEDPKLPGAVVTRLDLAVRNATSFGAK